MVSLKRALRRRRHIQTLLPRLKDDDSSLTEVRLVRDGVTDADVVRLSTALSCNTSVRLLDLSGNKITARGARSLATALLSNGSVEAIRLNGNPLGDEGVGSLCQALRSGGTAVETLYLRRVGMGRYGAQALGAALAGADVRELPPSLEEVDPPSPSGVFEHDDPLTHDMPPSRQPSSNGSQALNENRSLNGSQQSNDSQEGTLHEEDVGSSITGNSAESSSARGTSSAPAETGTDSVGSHRARRRRNRNAGMSHLDLADNPGIGNRGASAIASALRSKSCRLSRLNLAGAGIRDRGATELGKALTENRILRHLDLYGNGVGDTGAERIAEALWFNRTVRTMNLGWNKMGNTGKSALASALDGGNNGVMVHLFVSTTSVFSDPRGVVDLSHEEVRAEVRRVEESEEGEKIRNRGRSREGRSSNIGMPNARAEPRGRSKSRDRSRSRGRSKSSGRAKSPASRKSGMKMLSPSSLIKMTKDSSTSRPLNGSGHSRPPAAAASVSRANRRNQDGEVSDSASAWVENSACSAETASRKREKVWEAKPLPAEIDNRSTSSTRKKNGGQPYGLDRHPLDSDDDSYPGSHDEKAENVARLSNRQHSQSWSSGRQVSRDASAVPDANMKPKAKPRGILRSPMMRSPATATSAQSRQERVVGHTSKPRRQKNSYVSDSSSCESDNYTAGTLGSAPESSFDTADGNTVDFDSVYHGLQPPGINSQDREPVGMSGSLLDDSTSESDRNGESDTNFFTDDEDDDAWGSLETGSGSWDAAAAAASGTEWDATDLLAGESDDSGTEDGSGTKDPFHRCHPDDHRMNVSDMLDDSMTSHERSALSTPKKSNVTSAVVRMLMEDDGSHNADEDSFDRTRRELGSEPFDLPPIRGPILPEDKQEPEKDDTFIPISTNGSPMVSREVGTTKPWRYGESARKCTGISSIRNRPPTPASGGKREQLWDVRTVNQQIDTEADSRFDSTKWGKGITPISSDDGNSSFVSPSFTSAFSSPASGGAEQNKSPWGVVQMDWEQGDDVQMDGTKSPSSLRLSKPTPAIELSVEEENASAEAFLASMSMFSTSATDVLRTALSERQPAENKDAEDAETEASTISSSPSINLEGRKSPEPFAFSSPKEAVSSPTSPLLDEPGWEISAPDSHSSAAAKLESQKAPNTVGTDMKDSLQLTSPAFPPAEEKVQLLMSGEQYDERDKIAKDIGAFSTSESVGRDCALDMDMSHQIMNFQENIKDDGANVSSQQTHQKSDGSLRNSNTGANGEGKISDSSCDDSENDEGVGRDVDVDYDIESFMATHRKSADDDEVALIGTMEELSPKFISSSITTPKVGIKEESESTTDVDKGGFHHPAGNEDFGFADDLTVATTPKVGTREENESNSDGVKRSVQHPASDEDCASADDGTLVVPWSPSLGDESTGKLLSLEASATHSLTLSATLSTDSSSTGNNSPKVAFIRKSLTPVSFKQSIPNLERGGVRGASSSEHVHEEQNGVLDLKSTRSWGQ